jgi:heterodisulfide reductase subunit B
MRYALYPGCTVQSEQYEYEMSVREVLPKLGIQLAELDGAGCCGYLSYRVSSPIGWKYLTARNLALAEALSLDILTLCNSCHLSFSRVANDMEKDDELRKTLSEALTIEGLEYNGRTRALHILEVLHDQIGRAKIAEKIEKPLKGLNLAAHPGCYLFRPTDLKRPDNGKEPKKLDELIRTLGAESSDYPEKLECCGSTISRVQEKTSLLMAGSKLKAIKEHGFDGLVTICPHCFRIFDGRQLEMQSLFSDDSIELPVFYYTQLLGLSMGIPPEKLGLELNNSPVEGLIERVLKN